MQPRDRLTVREVHVATLVWQGLTNKEIATALSTSEQVVKNHLRSTFDKLGVWTRLELALYVAAHDGLNWHAAVGIPITPHAGSWSRKSKDRASLLGSVGEKAGAASAGGY
jgi:DNA-binding CsgD family transcriptional regulator